MSLTGLELTRLGYDGREWRSELYGLVIGDNGRTYLTTTEDGRRKSFVPERHRWLRDGEEIDDSAFAALQLGIDPDRALRHERLLQAAAEALAPENDRVPGKGKRFGSPT